MKPRISCILSTCFATQPRDSIVFNSCFIFISPILQRTYFTKKYLLYLNFKIQDQVSYALFGNVILTLPLLGRNFPPLGAVLSACTGSRMGIKLQKWTATHTRAVGNVIYVGAYWAYHSHQEEVGGIWGAWGLLRGCRERHGAVREWLMSILTIELSEKTSGWFS